MQHRQSRQSRGDEHPRGRQWQVARRIARKVRDRIRGRVTRRSSQQSGMEPFSVRERSGESQQPLGRLTHRIQCLFMCHLLRPPRQRLSRANAVGKHAAARHHQYRRLGIRRQGLVEDCGKVGTAIKTPTELDHPERVLHLQVSCLRWRVQAAARQRTPRASRPPCRATPDTHRPPPSRKQCHRRPSSAASHRQTAWSE